MADNPNFLIPCKQTFTVSSCRFYLDELPSGQPVSSVLETMKRYNHMVEWFYNRIYDQTFLDIPIQAANTTILLKEEYLRLYQEPLKDYYCTSLQSHINGMIRSQKELAKLYQEQNKIQITACEAKIKTIHESLTIHQEIKQYLIARSRSFTKGTPAPSLEVPETYHFYIQDQTICFNHKTHLNLYRYECSLDHKIRSEKNRITFIQEKIKRLQAKDFSIPTRITFGGRDFYKKKDTLSLSGPKLASWHKERDRRRVKSVNFSGRHDSRYGNFQCRYDVMSGRIEITLIDQKVLVLEHVSFPYRGDELTEYLKERRGSVGYTLELRTDGYGRDYLIVKAVITDEKEDFNFSTETGCIAFDTNADHLAWCELDGHGQKLSCGIVPFSLDDKNTDARKAELACAIRQIIKVAVDKKKPIAMEDLDFFRKKASMKYQGASHNRMLSAFAYAEITELTKALCYRSAIGLFLVPPAYTSLVGKLKYMRPLGCAIHTAAAYVIGRRAMGFEEHIPGYLRSLIKHSYPKSYFSRWKPVQTNAPKLPWHLFQKKISTPKTWDEYTDQLKKPVNPVAVS